MLPSIHANFGKYSNQIWVRGEVPNTLYGMSPSCLQLQKLCTIKPESLVLLNFGEI